MQDERRYLFSARDRHRLADAFRQIKEARLCRRVQAVLHVALGSSVAEAARWAGVDRASVHRWVALYCLRHSVEDLADQPRMGRPRQAEDLDADLLAEILQQDPRTVGYQATTWTVPLLQAYLREEYGCVLSSDTLHRRLHEYGWRWKRPRYVYGERAAHIGQKKGRLSAA
jgi:transposase